jgi:hypothetical protein
MATVSTTPSCCVPASREPRGTVHYVIAITCLLLFSGSAAGAPLDLANETTRTVLVQVDEDAADLAAIGSAFGPTLEADYSSTGPTRIIVIDGADIEDLIGIVFAGAASAVPGSFSDYVVEIDAATLEVLEASVSGSINVPIVGVVSVDQSADSTTLSGFEDLDVFGNIVPGFCTAGAGCTIVPGLPFDPVTGQVNAVGKVATTLFGIELFTPFGDLRFSELLDCEVATTQASYVDGEILTMTTLRYANLGPNPVESRLRLQLAFPAAFPITVQMLDLGAGGGFSLPGSFDHDLGPVQMFPIPSYLPRGQYSLRCALEDPTTGDVQAEDEATFNLD